MNKEDILDSLLSDNGITFSDSDEADIALSSPGETIIYDLEGNIDYEAK